MTIKPIIYVMIKNVDDELMWIVKNGENVSSSDECSDSQDNIYLTPIVKVGSNPL